MLLHRDPNFPALPLRRFCHSELQTQRDLYLATVMELRAQTSRTLPLSVTVIRASDGASIDYAHVISSLRRRKDGTVYHRVTARGVGGFETLSECVRAILRAQAAQWEQTLPVCLSNPVTGVYPVSLQAGPM